MGYQRFVVVDELLFLLEFFSVLLFCVFWYSLFCQWIVSQAFKLRHL